MTKPDLRLVENKRDFGIFSDLEALRLTDAEAAAMAQAKRPGPQQRVGKLFARVPLTELATVKRDGGFPAWVRLYLMLRFRSHDCAKPVSLTNAMAASAGLDRHSKSRRLDYLEAHGLVTVARSGRKSPVVTVHPVPPPPNPSSAAAVVADDNTNSP
jgi:hypothetical protein